MMLAATPVSEPTVKVEADGSRTMTHKLVVKAGQAETWAAIASEAGWESWAVPVAWTSATDSDLLETSYDPAAAPGNPNNITQRFLVRVPGRMLAFRTVKAPQGFPHFDTYAKVTSVFELEPMDEKRTKVTLTGVGYAPGAAGDALLGFFKNGNATALEALGRSLGDD